MKALVEAAGDRILGFTVFGVGAGEIMSAVQIAMIAGLPYTALLWPTFRFADDPPSEGWYTPRLSGGGNQ